MATSAYAQTEVLTGVTRGKDYGVVYALPKTQIEIEIKAKKHERKTKRHRDAVLLFVYVI